MASSQASLTVDYQGLHLVNQKNDFTVPSHLDEPSSVFSHFYNLDRLNVPATANRTLAFEVEFEERGRKKNKLAFLSRRKCSIDMIPIYCKCVVVGDGCVKSFLASFFLFYIR